MWIHGTSRWPSGIARQIPRDRRAIPFSDQMDLVYRRLTQLTGKPVTVCEFGTILDEHHASWAKAALEHLLGGRGPRVMGFSWWNAAFHNDSVTDRESNMRVQDSPALERVFRKYVGRGIAVLSRVVTGPPAMLR